MKVLVIGAHPDDELLGAGGTAAKHALAGDSVVLAILCEGESTRYGSQRRSVVSDQSRMAASILGAETIVIRDLPDQRLDTLPISVVAREVESLVKEHLPNIVYTHFIGDLNRDHRVIAEATLIATRPYSAPSVAEVWMFETPSSTEWGEAGIPISFTPTMFVDITQTLAKKLDALLCYEAEVRDSPHPRSVYGLTTRAAHWGSINGTTAAEAFMPVRVLR